MTPNELIRLAIINSGIQIPQTIYAEEVYMAFDELCMMLGQWNRKRWLVYNLVDIACTATGQASYTVGPTGDFVVPRIDSIEYAYARLLPINPSGAVDVPLVVIDAREDYSRIAVKNITAFPYVAFLDTGYPLGTLHVWPIPTANMFEIHIVIKNTIPLPTNLSTDMGLPPEYNDAVMWGMACRLRTLWGAQPDPSLMIYAKNALNVIRGANAQIPKLSMPAGVGSNRSGRWAGHGIPQWGSLG